MRIFFVVTKICRKFKKNSIWMHSWQGLRMRTMKIIRCFLKIKFFQQNWSKFIWNRNEVKWTEKTGNICWNERRLHFGRGMSFYKSWLKIKKTHSNSCTEREAGRKSQSFTDVLHDWHQSYYFYPIYLHKISNRRKTSTQNVIRIAWNNCKIANPESP